MTKKKDWRDDLPSTDISLEETPTSGTLVKDNLVLVPAMTEEEVAQSIASKGKRMVAVVPPQYCTAWQFKQIMAATFMLYTRGKCGDLPTYDDVANVLSESVALTKIKKTMASPQFRHAMLVRGIDYSAQRTISPEQDMAIAIMATPDGRKFEQKLKAAGVAPSKWRAWLQQKAFRETWEAAGGTVLKDHEGDMMVALVGQALQGDTNAIKYAFEVSGRHAPLRQQNVDATVLIAQMIEIIQEEVKDTETLQRIAARMQMVGSTPSAQAVLQTAHQPELIEG